MKNKISVALCVECGIREEEEGEQAEMAGMALFAGESLSAQMGYKPGVAGVDDYLGIAQMMAERLAEALNWDTPPMVDTRLERDGLLIRAVVNPGFIANEAWESFVEAFQEICAFYENSEPVFAKGYTLTELLDDQLPALGFKARREPEPGARHKAPKP